MSLGAPFPPVWSVRQARDAYLAENGFTVASYDDRFTDAKLLGITFKIPNTRKHRWSLMWHDLHHALLGYGTDPAGEAEVSAWELRRGLRPLGLYVGGIVTGGVAMGLLVAPRRTFRAFQATDRRPSLFHEPLPYEQALDLTVGELRERLGVPREGLNLARRGQHAGAPRSAVV